MQLQFAIISTKIQSTCVIPKYSFDKKSTIIYAIIMYYLQLSKLHGFLLANIPFLERNLDLESVYKTSLKNLFFKKRIAKMHII